MTIAHLSVSYILAVNLESREDAAATPAIPVHISHSIAVPNAVRKIEAAMRDKAVLSSSDTHHRRSAGRALIWLLIALAITLGLGIPIYRAASQSSTNSTSSDQTTDTNSLPAAVLQLFQNQANSPPWNQDTAAKTADILQQCATLQQLLASNAPDATLSNALVASTLRVSVFMTFGQTLSATGDTHHAEMFFTSVVNDHPTRATAKQLGRCYLSIATIHKTQALAFKYQQQSPDQAAPEFQAALANFFAAKNVSATNDWARDVGWLGTADCYHELGGEAQRQECFRQLMAEANPVPLHRDMANYLLAASFAAQHRWQDAIDAYQQLYAQLTATLAAGPPQYAGQANYLTAITNDLALCTARLPEQTAP